MTFKFNGLMYCEKCKFKCPTPEPCPYLAGWADGQEKIIAYGTHAKNIVLNGIPISDEELDAIGEGYKILKPTLGKWISDREYQIGDNMTFSQYLRKLVQLREVK